MIKKKIVKTTDWLTKGMSKEQLEREKREAIMSADLQLCIVYDEWSAREYGTKDVDFDTTAEKMIAMGYRKKSEWISVDERLPDKEDKYLVVLEGQITIQRFNPRDGINNTWWKNYISHWMLLPGLPKGE